MAIQSVNPNMIILAREFHGLNQKELAEKLNIQQGTLSKAEMGLLSVKEDLLAKLARVLKFPKGFFFQNGELFKPNLYYRKKYRTSKRLQYRAEAQMNLHRLNVQKLLQSVEINTPPLPNFNVEIDGSPQTIAKKLREYWGVPRGPVKNVYGLLESRGLIVVPVILDSDKISGATLFTEDKHVVLFINKKMPMDRCRFTAMHETFHILAHVFNSVDDTRDVEREADYFASEFLMPEDDIRTHFKGRITLSKLADLKRHWGVAMSALIMKANQLGEITDRHKKTLFIEMSKLGFRKKEPAELEPRLEKPTMIQNLLNAFKEELDYSDEDLAKLLNLNIGFFMDTYQHPDKVKLKLTIM